MNEDDLRTLLADRADRAAATAGLPADDRLDAVHGRVRSVRRRRAGLAAGGTAAAVAAAVVVLPLGLGDPQGSPGPAGVNQSPTVDSSPVVNRIDGFPEYDQGYRLFAVDVEDLPRRTVEVTVVPRTLDLRFGESCDFSSTDNSLPVELRIQVNGRFLGGSDCLTEDGGAGFSMTESRLETHYGVRVGEPMTVTVRAVKGVRYTDQGPVDQPLPETGEFGIGVYQRIDAGPLKPPDAGPLKPRADIHFLPYDGGGRLLKSATAPLSAGRVEVTFTPSSLHLSSAEACQSAERGVYVRIHLAGQPKRHWGGSCSSASGGSSAAPSAWRELGVEVGEPATLVMRVVGSGVTGQGPVPRGDGELGLAIYEAVPFEDYPLPSPPSSLAPLRPDFQAVIERLDADPQDPLAPVEAQLRLRRVMHLNTVSQTPGFLRVEVEGVRLTTCKFYDYEANSCGVAYVLDFLRERGLRAGDVVRVRVVPQHVTGDWAVAFERAV